ncbi:hypothetical protein P171DRAFT_502169 [Karstenula rhodostoma CBS 690.94]|uniref:Uncharacterized protein n=1 Tax=Karstenula rhodostoma CBS 690.94 TaxID=1392251 RepID=A0A9P4P9L1_9PLEO|nr:hypothetical protein P171DRAFT_502169 [Karstenula rhodostoma CBS 690.94]
MSKRRASSTSAVSTDDNKPIKSAKQTAGELSDTIVTQTQSPFFSKLNYDVRYVIYDCLYLHLPPLARKWNANGVPQDDCCQGLILSCKLANQELLETAGRHLKMYLDECQEKCERYYGKPITIHGEVRLCTGWETLRSVTLSIAVKYLHSRKHNSSGFQHRLDIDVDTSYPWDPLRRLLERPFDRVTLLFTCPEVERASPEYEVTNSIWHHLMEMHTDIGTTIGQEWLRFQWGDDIDKLRQYRETPSLIVPHIKHDRNRCCYKCSINFSPYECVNPDNCENENCKDHFQPKCNGKDLECDSEHRPSLCDLDGGCKYGSDADCLEGGPKRRDYDSDEEHRFARVQWNRLCAAGVRELEDLCPYYPAHISKRIQTKEIVFAWDYRSSNEPLSGKLLGEKQRYQQTRAEELAEKDLLRVPVNDEEYDEEWPYACYLDLEGWDGLLNNDSLAGMWVIGHPKRWMLTSQEVLDEDNSNDGMGLGLTNGRKERVECAGMRSRIVARTTELTPWPGLNT